LGSTFKRIFFDLLDTLLPDTIWQNPDNALLNDVSPALNANF
jgi:hypothetical protein